ncbi:MAG: hypothetical protein AAF490_04995 [Chloroflexota bacterium]
MSFEWLNKFHQDMDKPHNYADKVLAAYKLGMRSRGSIAGVRVELVPKTCAVCSQVDETAVYHPDDAPRLPLENCQNEGKCRCVYRPVMTYEEEEE